MESHREQSEQYFGVDLEYISPCALLEPLFDTFNLPDIDFSAPWPTHSPSTDVELASQQDCADMLTDWREQDTQSDGVYPSFFTEAPDASSFRTSTPASGDLDWINEFCNFPKEIQDCQASALHTPCCATSSNQRQTELCETVAMDHGIQDISWVKEIFPELNFDDLVNTEVGADAYQSQDVIDGSSFSGFAFEREICGWSPERESEVAGSLGLYESDTKSGDLAFRNTTKSHMNASWAFPSSEDQEFHANTSACDSINMDNNEFSSQDSDEFQTDHSLSQDSFNSTTARDFYVTPQKTTPYTGPNTPPASPTDIQQFALARQENYMHIINRTGKATFFGLDDMSKLKCTLMQSPALPPGELVDCVSQLEEIVRHPALAQAVPAWNQSVHPDPRDLDTEMWSQSVFPYSSSPYASQSGYQSPYPSLGEVSPEAQTFANPYHQPAQFHNYQEAPYNMAYGYLENPFLDNTSRFITVDPQFVLGSCHTPPPHGHPLAAWQCDTSSGASRKRLFEDTQDQPVKDESLKRAKLADIPRFPNVMSAEERTWDDTRTGRERKDRETRRRMKASLPIKIPGYPSGNEDIPRSAWENKGIEVVRNYPNHLHGPVLEKLVELGWNSRMLSETAGSPSPYGPCHVTRNAMHKRIGKLTGAPKAKEDSKEENTESEPPSSQSTQSIGRGDYSSSDATIAT